MDQVCDVHVYTHTCIRTYVHFIELQHYLLTWCVLLNLSYLCYCSSILFTYMINGCLPMGYLYDLVLHCHNESNDENPLLKMVCVCVYTYIINLHIVCL